MRRTRPCQHIRKYKSGKRRLINKGIHKKATRRMPVKLEPVYGRRGREKYLIQHNIIDKDDNEHSGFVDHAGPYIKFIEVREDKRGKNLGKETVEKLLDKYGYVKGRTKAASNKAVHFWAKMGARVIPNEKREFDALGDDEFILTKEDYKHRKNSKYTVIDDLGNTKNYGFVPIDKSEIVTLYHGTKRKNLESIKKSGLEPRSEYFDDRKAVFLTPSLSSATYHAKAGSEIENVERSKESGLPMAAARDTSEPLVLKVNIRKDELPPDFKRRLENKEKLIYEVPIYHKINPNQISVIDYNKARKKAIIKYGRADDAYTTDKKQYIR